MQSVMSGYTATGGMFGGMFGGGGGGGAAAQKQAAEPTEVGGAWRRRIYAIRVV